MRKVIFITIVFIIQSMISYGQNERYTNSILKKKIEELKLAGEPFHTIQILSFVSSEYHEQHGNFALYKIDYKKLKESFSENHELINFILPLSNGKKLEIYLMRNEIFTGDFKETVTDEYGLREINNENGHLYHGIINEPGKRSVACISIFRDEIAGIICDESGNWNLGKIDESGNYAYYNDQDFDIKFEFKCGDSYNQDTTIIYLEDAEMESSLPIDKCVRISVDCDSTFVASLGSTGAVKNYIQNIFNMTSTLYGIENVSVSISDIHYWVNSDPFRGDSSSNALWDLGIYYAIPGSYNGNVLHLLAVDAGANGGLAQLSSICGGLGYSDLKGNEPVGNFTFPTYTWDVSVLTHELGHNFGSQHTHDCVWNGNNTSIDGCGPNAGAIPSPGGCSIGPIPGANLGTMMSYCHLSPPNNGIGFIEGFGPQPGQAIRNFVASKFCLGDCSGSCQPYISVGVPISTGNNLTFSSQFITFGSNNIASGATATFESGDKIRLNPGFHAFNGSSFNANISSCTPSPSAKLANSSQINNNVSVSLINVYPNPVNNKFTIDFFGIKKQSIQINLLDIAGRTILQENFITNQEFSSKEIEITTISKGVYLLQIISATETWLKKLVVE